VVGSYEKAGPCRPYLQIFLTFINVESISPFDSYRWRSMETRLTAGIKFGAVRGVQCMRRRPDCIAYHLRSGSRCFAEEPRVAPLSCRALPVDTHQPQSTATRLR
jgi:hypothetical protein